MLNTTTSGSPLLQLKISAIALDLRCIACKAARVTPISFLHIAREFGLERLAGGANEY
jgi:hypothetical protein